jgi:hypothetical protein
VQSFGGGGLAPQAGVILRENGVRLHCSYGGTEFGAIATASLNPEDEDDWEYIEFSEICTPRWVPQGDGTYELQFLVRRQFCLRTLLLILYIDQSPTLAIGRKLA